MTLNLVGALTVLLMATTAASAQENANAIDGRGATQSAAGHRERLVPTSWPWQAVGRVNIVSYRQRRHCTGTLVGPRLVLTAAHCLFDPQLKKWVRSDQVHFVAGQNGESAAGEAVADKIELATGFETFWAATAEGRNPSVALFAQDWALITLSTSLLVRPVPIKVVTPVDIAAGLSGKHIARVGYGDDRPYMQTVVRDCAATLTAVPSGLMQNQCEAHPGDSGSPILLLDGADAVIIGLSTGVANDMQADGRVHPRMGLGPSAAAFADAVARALAREH